MIYALLALVAVVVAYLLFFRKSEPEQLASRPAKEESSPQTKAAASAETDQEAAPELGLAPSKPTGKARAADGSPSPPRASHPPPSAARPPPPPTRHARAPRDIEGLRRGLSKARASEGFFGRLRALFAGK